MANTFAVSRNHLIFGLCLPLAVLLGYLLAEPLDSSSLAVVVMVVSVLALPVMIKGHHFLLIVSWNAMIAPYFIKGQPQLWMMIAFVSLFFGILGRSVSAEKKFLHVPSVVKALLCFLAVVLCTAFATGGIGLRLLGSENYGGKNYLLIFAAIAGYFAFTSKPIPLQRAKLYVAIFFLMSLTSLVSNLVYFVPSLWFLYQLFPVSLAMDQAAGEWAIGPSVVRISGVIWASQGIYSFMLARYGIRGVFDLAKPWRLGFFLLVLFASLFGGFRSTLVLFLLVFATQFFVEGLWKTRIAFLVAAVLLVSGALAVLFANRMPFSVQRTLAILPLDLDPMVKHSAQSSTEWRLEMWKALLPDLPNYLFTGRGYSLSGRELEMIQNPAFQSGTSGSEGAVFAGDYHNGPLSLLVPFGLYGVAAFTILAIVGIRFLTRNYRYGHPSLRQINAFLLALFVARLLFFGLIFGAISSDLYYFTGILGLGAALNNGEAKPGTEWDEEKPG